MVAGKDAVVQTGLSQVDSSRLTVLPATQLVKWPKASFRAEGTSLVSTANQLVVTSPVAKKHSTEQPPGTCTLRNVIFQKVSFSKA